MAAGTVQLSIKDGGGTSRNVNQRSSDGTLTGNLEPQIYAIDGEIETIGAKADAPWSTGSGSLVALGKAMVNAINAPLPGAVTTAAPTYTTGTTQALSLNTAGALRTDGSGVTQPVSGTVAISGNVSMIDAFAAPVTTNWTNATALNTAQQVATAGYDTVIVTLVGNGALSGGAVVFEVFDGATWLAIKAGSIQDYTTTGGPSLTANMNKGYQIPVAGFPQFRVRLGTVITAGQLIVATIASSAPDTSVLTVGLDPAAPLPAGTNPLGSVGMNGTAYKTVAASQTTQVLGATGAVGDLLLALLIIPATTSPGAVSITDGNGAAITVFTGGASSVSNLVPFTIPLNIKTVNATTPGWKVTTGANVSCVATGSFT
jgi:hypothetical protein